MSDDDDALSRANKFLAIVPGREVAKIDNDAIAALLKEAKDSTRPKEPPRPVETKPQPRPAQEPVREWPRNSPPAVAAQPKPSVAVQSQTPGVTAEVLPPAAPAPGQGQPSNQNITIVVNTPAPAVHPYPWWGYPYYPAVCPACGRLPHHCMRWRCPY
jgi:anti-sigma factor RsiW